MATSPGVFLIKKGSAAAWAASTVPLNDGELGAQDDVTPPIIKLGNGTALWSALTSIDTVGTGGGGGGASLEPSSYYVTATDVAGSASAVRTQLQAILNTYAGVPTKIVMPYGVTTISMGTHPGGGAGFGICGLALRSCNQLIFPPGAQLRIDPTYTLTAESRVITNWQMNSGTADTDIKIIGMDNRTSVINGSAGTVISSTIKQHGIQLWRTLRTEIRDIRIIDCNGYNTGAQENFFCDFIRCQTAWITDVVCERTAGTTATLHSSSFSDDLHWTRCRGQGSTNGHGFALYSCSRCTYTDCVAELNGSKGFNLEHCDDVSYRGCISGGITSYQVDNGTPIYTKGQDRGNTSDGFNINTTSGGNNISMVGCHSSGNNAHGMTILGGIVDTATTGTTGSTIVAGAGTFFPTCIGRWVTVGARNPQRISGYTSDTTVTTAVAHGGASGDAVEVWGGAVRVDDCFFHDNTTGGVQFNNGAGATAKRNDVRMTRFGSSCEFSGNASAAMVDVGSGSSVTLTEFTSGFRIPDTLSSNWVTATQFVNPFPMDVLLVGVGATAVTTIGARTSPYTQNSSGVQSGAMVIGPGVSFVMTSTTQARFFII